MAENNTLVAPVGWTPASVLANATGDAMTNIFDVLVKWPWEGTVNSGEAITDSEAAVSYRCDGFDPPEVSTDTYDVTWHGVKVYKIKAGVNMDRKLTLTFRLDANYALYQKWLAWEKFHVDVNTSGVANSASALGTIQVIAPGSEYNAMSWSTPTKASDNDNLLTAALASSNLVWSFEDCAVVKVGQPKFKNEATGNHMTYTVEIIFGDAGYPFYSTANAVNHNHKQ